jgi:hypothetical protein
MKGMSAFCLFMIMLFPMYVSALPPIEGKIFGITPLVNEVSFYKNTDDAGNDRGGTIQVISINTFRVWTEFNLEFTADFNFDMAYDLDGTRMDNDHYLEISLVKPVNRLISFNYQRIYSTFEDRAINQFGLRLSF